jgi:hypothetical protein
MFEDILLEPEQRETLSFLIEVARNVPREKRSPFMFLRMMGGGILTHPGAGKQWNNTVYWGDIEQLGTAGLLRLTYGAAGDSRFEVTPLGFKYYEWMKQQAGQPLQVIESEIRRYLGADSFRKKYPMACQKLAEAASLLWSSDSEQQLTTIGHLCREAMQAYISVLVEQYQTPGVDTDKAHTVARLKSVIAQQAGRLGDTMKPCLDALVEYWGTVSDLVQRQAHGGQKEGQQLVWEDGRRVVFQTTVVMFEIDMALS